MVQKGFGLDRAYKCQHLPLAGCQADFDWRWNELGQRHGAIGDAWVVEAPPPAPTRRGHTGTSSGPFSPETIAAYQVK